ncbi:MULTISPECIES: protease SohB [unclassified Motilimonas]|uniref:protease SohB n=1 Tax=unclassified Motilimonas TaxID=2643697 RepID=UPI001E4DB589|nr:MULTISPECIES: protease SohB [unclassified Motilimonas]MCE0557623.1 protease SohB [Motilimonas sp. E26]MDO6526300.1 protease SohB [Motilimonas sp. 1_MG-2023]
MEFLYEYGLFFAKTLTFVAAILAIIVTAVVLAAKQKAQKGELLITDLSEQLNNNQQHFEEQLLSEDELKAKQKAEKKAAKAAKKAAKKSPTEPEADVKNKLYVVDFKGSIDAKEVSSLREEVTAILGVVQPNDEVLVRLESGGGMVHGYGLASSQLQRLRAQGVNLTVSVDKVAASGGYMMACVAPKIIAAPFAIIGSIGVIAQIPNFNRLLKKHDVDFEQMTAGEFKRTVTMFGENTEKGKEKFQQELEETHVLFKEFVSENRPQLDINKVATGEHWYGSQAFSLNLIDKVQTSDDYLLQQNETKTVIAVRYAVKKKLADKIAHAASLAFERCLMKLWQQGKGPFINS